MRDLMCAKTVVKGSIRQSLLDNHVKTHSEYCSEWTGGRQCADNDCIWTESLLDMFVNYDNAGTAVYKSTSIGNKKEFNENERIQQFS